MPDWCVARVDPIINGADVWSRFRHHMLGHAGAGGTRVPALLHSTLFPSEFADESSRWLIRSGIASLISVRSRSGFHDRTTPDASDEQKRFGRFREDSKWKTGECAARTSRIKWRHSRSPISSAAARSGEAAESESVLPLLSRRQCDLLSCSGVGRRLRFVVVCVCGWRAI